MQKKDKIAIFGGTFNPPHQGHVHLLNAFKDNMHFDKILILPAAIPPHKKARDLATGEQRVQMCRLAFPDCEICDYEVKKGGKNYTADTLEYLKTVYVNAQFYFIMGTDMFLSFRSWRDPERILKNAVLLCDGRDNTASPEQLRRFALNELGLTREQFVISEVKPLPLSSTRVREALACGEDVQHLLPKAVAEYIKKEGLYAK